MQFEELKTKIKNGWHKLVDGDQAEEVHDKEQRVQPARGESIDSRMGRAFASSDAQAFTDLGSTQEPTPPDFAEWKETRPRTDDDDLAASTVAAPIVPRSDKDIINPKP